MLTALALALSTAHAGTVDGILGHMTGEPVMAMTCRSVDDLPLNAGQRAKVTATGLDASQQISMVFTEGAGGPQMGMQFHAADPSRLRMPNDGTSWTDDDMTGFVMPIPPNATFKAPLDRAMLARIDEKAPGCSFAMAIPGTDKIPGGTSIIGRWSNDRPDALDVDLLLKKAPPPVGSLLGGVAPERDPEGVVDFPPAMVARLNLDLLDLLDVARPFLAATKGPPLPDVRAVLDKAHVRLGSGAEFAMGADPRTKQMLVLVPIEQPHNARKVLHGLKSGLSSSKATWREQDGLVALQQGTDWLWFGATKHSLVIASDAAIAHDAVTGNGQPLVREGDVSLADAPGVFFAADVRALNDTKKGANPGFAELLADPNSRPWFAATFRVDGDVVVAHCTIDGFGDLMRSNFAKGFQGGVFGDDATP